MAETKPKRSRRKLTPTEAVDAVKALVAENEALKARVDALMDVVTAAESARGRAQTEQVREKNRADGHLAELHRIRTQAAQVKTWAGRHAHGNNVLIHAIDAVLFKPGYGEVHPFARWGHPPLV